MNNKNILQYFNNLGLFHFCLFSLIAIAFALRVWDVDQRIMHYDEAIHVYYSWQLFTNGEYIHSPWMHGPFQIEMVAGIFKLLSDSELTSRLGYVLFGTGLVGLPYFLRKYWGDVATLTVSLLLAISPILLYFSRFGRNDIIIAFWSTTLFILLWRYIHEGRNRYLFLSAAVLALMFSTKETAFFVTLILSGFGIVLGINQWIPALFRRHRFSLISGPTGFFILLVSLSLPQWSAAAGLMQKGLALHLVSPDGVTGGLVGAPLWAPPLVNFPIYSPPIWIHILVVSTIGCLAIFVNTRKIVSISNLMARITISGIAIFAFSLTTWTPDLIIVLATNNLIYAKLFPALLGLIMSFGLLKLTLGASIQKTITLIVLPVSLLVLYSIVFTNGLNPENILPHLLPSGIVYGDTASGIPLNFVVTALVSLSLFVASVTLGIVWKRLTWIYCAVIFYSIWILLHTTFFTNSSGVFTGGWQSLGYWIAQQDVARGDQPWYYYIVGLSVYELLPTIFTALGAIYFFKRGNLLGMLLFAWALLSLLAYTLASEKMPWLLVNIVVPMIFISGYYISNVVCSIPWNKVAKAPALLLMLSAPCILVLLSSVVLNNNNSPISLGITITATLIILVISAVLIRPYKTPIGAHLIYTGLALTLISVSLPGMYRLSYTFDDSNKEFLVYAQGSSDLKTSVTEIIQTTLPISEDRQKILIDYDMWFPIQWYVRHQSINRTVEFKCFKPKTESGWNESCIEFPNYPKSDMLLLASSHKMKDLADPALIGEPKVSRNLLWFPEIYRNPAKHSNKEPIIQQLQGDFVFFKDSILLAKNWRPVLRYILFRELPTDWYYSEYYEYSFK